MTMKGESQSSNDLSTMVDRVRALVGKVQDALVGLTPSSPPATGDNDPAAIVKRLAWERSTRDKFFPRRFAKGPAWSILLMLYQCRALAETISVTSLSYSVDAPLATGHRWIDALKQAGYCDTYDSRSDARATLVTMTDSGFEKMTSYLQSISNARVMTASPPILIGDHILSRSEDQACETRLVHSILPGLPPPRDLLPS